jgi:hypothetical protein
MNNNYGNGAGGFVLWLIYVVAIVFYVFCMWRIFVKAGKPGWAAIIPIYNVLVELEIVGRPWYWLLLMFIPVVDVVLGIIVIFRFAKVFGHSIGFGFGLLLLAPIFFPILAFDESKYLGPTVE